MPLKTVALLVVLKIVATATCYASGNAGGIFGPSLFIGAMLGGAVGSVAHHFLPALTADPGAYALVGMGTAFAGIVRTPLTSVDHDLRDDARLLHHRAADDLQSDRFFISYRLQREPIYEALALQEGVYLPSGKISPNSKACASARSCAATWIRWRPNSRSPKRAGSWRKRGGTPGR